MHSSSKVILPTTFSYTRRQANEVEDSPFCLENVPIRAIIPFAHEGSLLFV